MSFLERLSQKTFEEKNIIIDNVKALDISDISQDLSTISHVGSTPKKNTTELLESSTGWVYACVDAIANEIASIDFKLYQQRRGEAIEIYESPILEILHKVNSFTTKFDFFYLVQNYLELAGEAPVFVGYENNQVSSMLLLRPDRITILPPKNDGEIIGGYKYKIYTDQGTREITLETSEVLFFKYPDPAKNLRGKGTLEAVSTSFDIDELSESYNYNFYKNSATPSSVLKTEKKLSRDVKTKLERIVRSKYEGVSNAHKTLILEQGLEFERMSLSQKEMDFIESQRFTRDKILAIFRVPRSVLGITEDVNRANAEASDYVFAKRTIKPKMQKLVEMLNEFFVPLFDNTGTLYLDYTDPVPENQEIKIKSAQIGLQAGYMTVNEARAINGLDPVEGGDEIREPFSATIQAQANRSMPVNRKYLYSKAKQQRANKLKQVAKKEFEQSLHKKVESKIYAKLVQDAERKKRLSVNKVFTGSPEEVQKQKYDFQERQLKIMDEHEIKFYKKMNSIFEAQKKKTLQALPKKTARNFTTKAINPDDYLLDEEAEIEITLNTMDPVVYSVIVDQSREAFRLLGQDNALTRRLGTVSEYLEKRVFDFSFEITKETNKKLGKQLAEAVELGEGIPKIRKRIRELFDNMQTYRSERIARSETTRASSFATEESYVQSGVVEAKEWLTFIDANTDEECLAMNGKIIGLNEKYFNKGDTFGQFKLDYENIKGPPLHVNCRCSLIPVVIA